MAHLRRFRLMALSLVIFFFVYNLLRGIGNLIAKQAAIQASYQPALWNPSVHDVFPEPNHLVHQDLLPLSELTDDGSGNANKVTPFYNRLLPRVGPLVDNEDPANDEDWHKAICSGEMMLWLLASDNPSSINPAAIESPWTYDQLPQHGWNRYNVPKHDLPVEDLEDMFDALGISKNPSRAASISWHHPATNGIYKCHYYPIDGLILATMRFGPQWQPGMSQLTPEQRAAIIPPVKQFSDIGFLEYAYQAQSQGTSPAGLKYLLAHSIINARTNKILSRVHLEKKANVGRWNNRVTVTMDTDQGKAAFGTANALGVGWLLLQHRALLGKKTVSKIDIFASGTGPGSGWGFEDYVDMLIYIVDVPPTAPPTPTGL